MFAGQQCKRGPWVEEKTLGSGGFGTVVLWKNEVCIKILFYNYVFFKKNLDRSLGANIQTDVSSGPSLNDFVEGY